MDVSEVTDEAESTIVNPSRDKHTTIDNKMMNGVELAPVRRFERTRRWRVRVPRAGDHVFDLAPCFLVVCFRAVVFAVDVFAVLARFRAGAARRAVVAVLFFETADFGRAVVVLRGPGLRRAAVDVVLRRVDWVNVVCPVLVLLG